MFDWMEFQRDGQPFPAPNLTTRPAQQIMLQSVAAGRRSARRSSIMDIRPTGIVWHPDGKLVAFIADTTWRDEIEVRPARPLDGHDRRRACTRLTDDGYVHSDLGFFAGRQVPVVRADVRHGHDHPAEAQSRRAARSVRAVRVGGWRADQPHREMGSRARRLALVAGRKVPLFHAPTRAARAICSASSGRPAASGRAGHEGRAPPQRLHPTTATSRRWPTRSACTTRRADVYVASIDGSGERRLSDVHRESRAGDRVRADRARCNGRARTARRSKAG